MNIVSKSVLPLIALFGIGLLALPEQASAAVTHKRALTTSCNMCVHRSGAYEQVHAIKMTANQAYVIDVMSTEFDTYVFLEDASGNLIDSNDDGGNGLNARLVFTPSTTGTYNIVVSSFYANTTGNYTMRVSP